MPVCTTRDKPLLGLEGSPGEKGCCCKGHTGARDHSSHMAGWAGLPGDAKRGLASRARLWGTLTLPLRLCTLKAMLGDMSRSSDSCSESFFFSLSMALLPLFALCGERLHGHISILRASATCSHLEPLPPTLGPRKTGAPPSSSAWHRALVSCCQPWVKAQHRLPDVLSQPFVKELGPSSHEGREMRPLQTSLLPISPNFDNSRGPL